MSYTTVYEVPKEGSIIPYKSLANSFLGGYNIWTEFAKYYLHLPDLPSRSGMEEVWDLAYSDEIPLYARVMTLSTFDNVMIKKTNIKKFIEALETFVEKHNPGYFPHYVQVLRELYQKDIFAICCSESCVSDTWVIYTNSYNENDERMSRWYDISKDKGHWFLFDRLCSNKNYKGVYK